jgi:ankyrin repeat protein
MKLLIEAGADVNAESNEGSTALMFAEDAGQGKAMKLLIKAGAV